MTGTFVAYYFRAAIPTGVLFGWLCSVWSALWGEEIRVGTFEGLGLEFADVGHDGGHDWAEGEEGLGLLLLGSVDCLV